jgi:hypothetical protein
MKEVKEEKEVMKKKKKRTKLNKIIIFLKINIKNLLKHYILFLKEIKNNSKK